MAEREKQNVEKINKQSMEEINKTTNENKQTDQMDFKKENLGIHQVKDDNNNQYEISEAKNNEKLSQENIGEK